MDRIENTVANTSIVARVFVAAETYNYQAIAKQR
jgi:hypothetical protein